MKDKKIKPYDGDGFFYSGSDEDYEEFLNNVSGSINTSEVIDDEDADNMGSTRRIDIQGVIDKFRKTAGDIKDASKKITADAISKIEDLKKSAQDSFGQDKEADEDFEYVAESERKVSEDADEYDDDGIVMDIDDIRKQINDAVRRSLASHSIGNSSNLTELIGESDKKIENLTEEYKKLYDLITSIEAYSRDNATSAENTAIKIDDMSNKTEEIRQAVLSISKLNDSIFDLKNTQLNVKKSLENLETGFNGLKKKCVLGITIISILTLISIAMSVVVMLS